MGPRNVTVSATVRSVGVERGVALVSCDGDVSAFTTKAARASGVRLRVFGVLSSLLYSKSAAGVEKLGPAGQKLLPPGSVVTVLVPEDLLPVVLEVVSSGEVRLAEAASTLPAVRAQVELAARLGVEVRFVAGEPVLSPEQSAALDAAAAALLVEEAEQVARTNAWELPSEDAAWVAEHAATVVYTDGSCLATSGFSSWAWCTDDGRSASGTVAAVSSSYVERRAALEALRSVDGPVLLVTDLTDLLPVVSSRVLARFEARVVKSLRRMVGSRQVRILAVKGHDVCPGNLAADVLAGEALTSAWALVSQTPGLQARLAALNVERKVNLREARRLANERRGTHALLYGPDKERYKDRTLRLRARTLASQGSKALVAA